MLIKIDLSDLAIRPEVGRLPVLGDAHVLFQSPVLDSQTGDSVLLDLWLSRGQAAALATELRLQGYGEE